MIERPVSVGTDRADAIDRIDGTVGKVPAEHPAAGPIRVSSEC